MNFGFISMNDKRYKKIFEVCGTACYTTDFALVTGCKTVGRVGRYWSSDYDEKILEPLMIDTTGEEEFKFRERSNVGCRPIINYSEIKDYITHKRLDESGLLEVEFGEYPKMVTNEAQLLENAYHGKALNETGKTYTTNDDLSMEEFHFIKNVEYEFNGRKYIRYIPPKDVDTKNIYLALNGMKNNEWFKKNKIVWLEVCPISWIVDEQNDVAITKDIVLSGIPFAEWNYDNSKEEYFKKSGIKKFLDEQFAKEIIPSEILEHKKTK